MEEYNIVELSKNESQRINGGGFLESVFVVVKSIAKYTSLTAALIVGVGDGILETLKNHRDGQASS